MLNFLHPRKPLTPSVEEIKPTTCKHSWELVAKTFAEPMATIRPDTTTAVAHGITTLLWNCSSCGEFHKEELIGSDENRWAKIVDDVNKHGMQYIKEGDKTYGVAVWMPEPTPIDISKLPRR